MTSSLFRKFLLLYLAVAVATLAGVSLSIGLMFKKRTYAESEERLMRSANQVSFLYGKLLKGETDPREFQRQISIAGDSSRVRISVLSKQGLSAFGEEPALKGLVAAVLGGQEAVVKGVFLAKDKQKMLIAGIPVQNGGAIFIYCPVDDIESVLKGIYKTILLSSLAIGAAVVCALFFLSRRLADPISRMSLAAENMAKGDFAQRVSISGKDEIAHLGRALNHMAERLERVEENRKRFISEISHEIRTPLTTVRASIQGILEGVVDENRQREFLEISLSETVRLGTLVGDLTELSAFEEKMASLFKSKMDVSKLLQETAVQISAEAREKGSRVLADIEPDVWMDADAGRIKQIALNLLANAVRHNPPDTEIGVSLRKSEDGVRIRVWDNGVGISPEHMPRLFDRFFKADESRSGKGAGLGLTISKHIAEAHGGTISAESEPGKGASFSLFFPASEQNEK